MTQTMDKRNSLTDVAGLVYLTPENAVFKMKGEFPAATVNEKDEDRVWLHRVFPFDMEWEFISVQTKDNEELGIIRDLSVFPEDQQEILKRELERKYFTPKIKRIKSLKEHRGFSYWQVETDIGDMDISLQDTYRSLNKIGEDRVIVTDMAGNRYEIESLGALDRGSRRKLELYL